MSIATSTKERDLRLSGRGLLAGELLKLRAQRFAPWLAGIIIADIVGAAVTAALGVGAAPGSTGVDAAGLAAAATGGVMIAQFAAMFLGVFAITAEFRTGRIRTTFLADPSRIKVMAAKAAAVGLIAFAATLVGTLLAVVVVAASAAAGDGLRVAWLDVELWRSVVGAAVFVGLIAVLSLAFGALFRRTAVAVLAVLVLLFALPGTAVLFDGGPIATIASFLPSAAGTAIYSAGAAGADPVFGALTPATSFIMPPWLGLIVLLGYVIVIAAFGLTAIRRRDV